MISRHLVVAPLLALIPLSFSALGCKYTEDEWQAQLAKYNQVVLERDAKEKELEAAKARVAQLEADLTKMGVEHQNLQLTLEERNQALESYKARARQLEAIKARFELLRRKLEALTSLGLAVRIRHNRMVISMPGDVLFDTGKETLRKDGEDIIGKVAAVIANDPSLANRDYQVAGHTDNQPLNGGVFHDNWGLSVMRARSVVVFLVGGKGTVLPREHWSAAGFADTDPVASNASKEGQQKNRRCDIIVVPSAEEMLDLTAIAR